MTTWATNPALINSELSTLRDNLHVAKQEFTKIEMNEERWLHSFESARLKLGLAISNCKEENNRLKEDFKQLYDNFMKDCNVATRTRRSVHIKDILDELDESKSLQDTRLREYEKIVLDAASGKNSNRNFIPTISVSVEELDYPWDKTSFTPNGSQANDKTADEQQSLAKTFSNVEESVKLSEITSADVEPYFLCEDQIEASYADIDGMTTDISPTQKRAKSYSPVQWSMIPGLAKEQQLCEGFLSLKNESAWLDHIEDVTKQHSSLAKRKRRGSGMVNISSFVSSRTPRNVRLLVSPLSQYEDRYIGAIYGGDMEHDGAIVKNPTPFPAQLPETLITEENLALQRCQLQSLAAAADTRVKRLRLAGSDWRKITIESRDTATKVKMLHTATIADDYNETARMRRELLAFGFAAAVSEDEISNVAPIMTVPPVFFDSSSRAPSIPKPTSKAPAMKGGKKKASSTPRNSSSTFNNLASVAKSLVGFSQSQ